MKWLIAWPLLLVSVLCLAGQPAKWTESGRVVYVDDGDTLVLLAAGNVQVKVRLASIDAPETAHTTKESGRIGQPYSDQARRYLAELVKGRQVLASCYELDRYGRAVCDIAEGGRSVNAEKVRAGLAWANQAAGGRYLRDSTLPQLQRSAEADRRGLWAGTHPVPPWEWRRSCWKLALCP